MTTSFARLHFIIARDADLAVILRRGPTYWTQLIKWDLRRDRFEYGQWFRGRISASRSDLSPSGRYLLYFAGDWRRKHREFGPTWTAISRPPYFTALAVWPEAGTWGGGGTFIEDHEVAFSSGGLTLAPGFSVPEKFQIGHRDSIRSDWQFGNLSLNADHDFGRLSISHRKASGGRLLIKAVDKVTWKERYYFIRQGGKDIWINECQCLDTDHRGRTLIAARGKIYALRPKDIFTSLDDLKPIGDFNDHKPEDIPCPPEMKKW